MKTQKEKNRNTILGIFIIAGLIISMICAIVFINPNPTYLKFNDSESIDIKSYKIYYELEPKVVTYDSKSYNAGLVTKINLSAILPVGKYNIGVIGIDKSGNESNMETLTINIL